LQQAQPDRPDQRKNVDRQQQEYRRRHKDPRDGAIRKPADALGCPSGVLAAALSMGEYVMLVFFRRGMQPVKMNVITDRQPIKPAGGQVFQILPSSRRLRSTHQAVASLRCTVTSDDEVCIRSCIGIRRSAGLPVL
jgi:hypothetical protein